MANAATHQGHCQVCGKLHMLPDGVLAKHGYTVEWGFFNGVCQGAGHLPFEQDVSLIEGMIRWATTTAAEEQAVAERLRAPATSPAVACDIYFRDGGKRNTRGARGGYVRLRGTVVAEPRNGYSVYFLEVAEGARAGRYRLESVYGSDVLAVATELNQRIASEHAKRAAELTKYAEWQSARIAGWVAHPEKLVPVADESKPKITVGMTVRIGGKKGWDGVVVAIENQTCHGCGPYLNGQFLPHAIFENSTGKRFGIPIRSIRLPKVAA